MKLLLIPLMMVGLLLSACDPITTQQATQTTGQVVATVKSVQSYTQQLCKFVPTVATLVALFNSGIGGNVASIGGAICDAVSTNPLAEGDVPGYYKAARVNGVAIKGKFTK